MSSAKDQGSRDLYWMGIEVALQCQTLEYGQHYHGTNIGLLRSWNIGGKILVMRASRLPQPPLIGNELDAGFFTAGNTIGEWSIRHFIIAREWTIWHVILSSLSGKYWFWTGSILIARPVGHRQRLMMRKWPYTALSPDLLGCTMLMHSSSQQCTYMIPLKNEFFDTESFRGPLYLKKRQIGWLLFESVGIW